jgi:Tol biopolymer transport system component
MTPPDRWQHVERLYHAALARDANERAAFLREACGDDEPLRREIESLLAYASGAEAFLGAPALEVVRPALMQPNTMTVPMIGRRLGSFEITSQLGSGGMGEVYRARDTTLGRDVAIKILPDVFTEDAERRARFEREARVLAALNHPHIAAIYGFEHREGIHGLVLELVEGDTLAKRLRSGPVALKEALTIARQIAEALEAAHEKGIVHRDLKPANITITHDGVVKVLDFGLAKATADERAPDLTHSPTVTASGRFAGVILGTAAYMSPEQARGKVVDKRTDVWAFGCVLYEMLTGRQTFGGATLSDTIAAILDREPEWSALPEATPSTIRRLLRRCLEKDPKRRLRDIGDAQLEFVDDEAPAPVRSSKASWRETAAWITAAVCLLGAVALAGYGLSRAPALRRVARFHVLPPEDRSLSVFGRASRDVALSADGRRLVFVGLSGADRQRRLWVRSVDSLDAQALGGTEGAEFPFWSPDGRFIAFFAQGKLRKVAGIGGAPQVLCDAPAGNGGTWGPAGTILFARTDHGLYQVSANGGNPVPVTTRSEGQLGHRYPQFLPDGRRFLFLAQSGQREHRGIYVGSLDSRETVRVLETGSRAMYAPPGYLLFIRGNALMLQAFDPAAMQLSGDVISIVDDVWYDAGGGYADFAVVGDVLVYRQREKNIGQLAWFSRAGEMLGSAGSRADYIHPWLSPDEKRAVVEIIDPDTGEHAVWMLDVVRGARSRFIAGAGGTHWPVWSADGSRILFSSDRSGPWSLLATDSTGAGAEQELLSTTTSSTPTDWSRDGRFIVYETIGPSTRSDIWALPVSPRGQPFPVATSAAAEKQGQLSPNGRWVAYVSDDPGREEIFVQAFPDAKEKWPISTTGGSQPQWRRDGKELFYISRDLKLMAVGVNTTTTSFEASVPTPLFDLTSAGHARNNYMPSADGKRFLINTSVTGLGIGSMAVVLDWTGLIRER